MLQLIDGRPRIAAAAIAESLNNGKLEAFKLQRHVIEGNLDLQFAHIAACIEVTGCEFTGRVDMRNAVFDGTALFRDCLFKDDVNAGDEELAHTLFKSDLSFDGSTFYGFVSFIGFCCEASVAFRCCSFEATMIRDSKMMGLRQPVEFNGGHVGKAFSVNKSVFKGCVTFNGLRCDFAGFFNEARFESLEVQGVDFTASYYNVAFELSKAVFEGAVNLSGVFCGFSFFANLVRFNHPNFWVSFEGFRSDYFSALGAHFAGPVSFSSLHCNTFDFRPFVISFNYPEDETWMEGDISQTLKDEIEKQVYPLSLPKLVKENGMWTLRFPDSPVRWTLDRDSSQLTVTVPSGFFGFSLRIDYAEIGLNILLPRAVIKGSADFSNLICKGDINLEAARFEVEAYFNLCQFRNINASGSSFGGEVGFNGLKCNRAFFDAYEIALNDTVFAFLDEGALPSNLSEVLVRNGFYLGDNCTLNHLNDRWAILDENGKPCAYIDADNQTSLKVMSRFFGKETSCWFNLGELSILVMDDAYVEGAARFNALHCTAGAFFRRTQFDGFIDFMYGKYGINLQMENAQIKAKAAFNGILINHDLIIEMAVFHEGADFTGAKIGCFRIGLSDPFRNKKSIFTGCVFDFFKGNWRHLVDQQDQEHFSLDLYLMLERFERATGDHSKADKIYHKGQSRETWRALKQLRLTSFFRGLLWSFFAGYGVHPFRSGIFCILVIALGVAVFWPDDALRPARKSGDTIQLSVTQIALSSSSLDANADKTCTMLLFDSSSTGIMLEQLGFNIDLNGAVLNKFISRLAFSIDEFMPLDLEIAKNCRPAPDWRQLYSAIHILFGWILIPLLVAAISGFLKKR